MASAKLVVLYPYPQDVDAFERAYTEEHVPMVNENTMKGITKFVATKVVGTADGSAPPFYRMAELHFPSLETLKECASSASAQEAVHTRSRFPAEGNRSSSSQRRRPQPSE